MRLIVLVLTLIISTQVAVAQDAMVKECEATATSNNDRAACARLAQCASQCGSDDSCLLECTKPGRGATIPSTVLPTPSQSVAEPAGRTDKPRDRTELCKQLYDFRDHRLFRLWETEQKKYDFFTASSDTGVKLREETAHLMDKEWWAGSTGAAAAVEIKFFSDLVGDAVALFVPAEQQVIHRAEEIARTVTGIGVITTYAKENAEAAAKQGWTEIFARYGGPIGSARKLLLDTAEYAKNKKDAAVYEDIAQDQVRQINNTSKMLDDKRKTAIEHADAYQQIVQGIDRLCASNP
jgi:hypothetical protein